jgi:hypothetical protein
LILQQCGLYLVQRYMVLSHPDLPAALIINLQSSVRTPAADIARSN